MIRIFGIVFLLSVLAGCGQKPGVVWEPYTPERMAAARQAGQPVILYFYASWCGPCHMMEQWTFRDERVIQALEPFVRLKADMSQKYAPQVQAIGRAYKVRALPTILFFNDKGVRVHMHYVGYVSAEKLLRIYKRR
jgi:thiol:disulfide interchange protein DsbD